MDTLTQIMIDPKKLRAAREKAGLTQEEVSERVGVIKQTVSHIECGVRVPSAHVLARLCVLYKLDIAAITKRAA